MLALAGEEARLPFDLAEGPGALHAFAAASGGPCAPSCYAPYHL